MTSWPGRVIITGMELERDRGNSFANGPGRPPGWHGGMQAPYPDNRFTLAEGGRYA